MRLASIEINNVGSIHALVWEPDASRLAGWHVVLGDNGAGKSTFLRAIALALVGPSEAMALRQDWNHWLRTGQDSGNVDVHFLRDNDVDKLTGGGQAPKKHMNQAFIRFFREQTDAPVKIGRGQLHFDPERSIWGAGAGWFCASYGPFRRFAGGDKDREKLFYSNPKLARHLSIFGESVALSECLEWLKLLKFKALEAGDPNGGLLAAVRKFVNQEDFLPHGAQLKDVSSEGVRFVDGNGSQVPVENLSDGYRSVLSMTFELIRQLTATYGASVFSQDGSKVIVPGVVLIDEIDAHLHPTWQLKVGYWFRNHFPSLQFIVSTHSPLVCHAATNGSVFRLPRPGSGETARMVQGTELQRLLYGNLLDAFGTGVFGEVLTRSTEAQSLLDRLASLNQRELFEKLDPAAKKEQSSLRQMLPTSASALPSLEAMAESGTAATIEIRRGEAYQTIGGLELAQLIALLQQLKLYAIGIRKHGVSMSKYLGRRRTDGLLPYAKVVFAGTADAPAIFTETELDALVRKARTENKKIWLDTDPLSERDSAQVHVTQFKQKHAIEQVMTKLSELGVVDALVPQFGKSDESPRLKFRYCGTEFPLLSLVDLDPI